MDSRKIRNIVTIGIIAIFGGLTAFLLWYQVTEASTAIAITLIITLIGVFAAQILGQSFIDLRNESIAENLLVEIQTELQTIIGSLERIIVRKVPYSLPIDAWVSAINSGKAAYFRNYLRSQLFNGYRLLNMYNLRASEYIASTLTGNIPVQDLQPIVDATIAHARFTIAALKAILAMELWPGGRTLYGPESIEEFRRLASPTNLGALVGQDWTEMEKTLDSILGNPET